jgi:hypothetical protein
LGSVLGIHRLTPHPEAPGASVISVNAHLMDLSATLLMVEFAVRSTSPLALPRPSPPSRADGLWTATCLELFLKPDGGEAYFEYNFSPSCAWAAYAFEDYRKGREELPMQLDPEIWLSTPGEHFFLSAKFEMPRPALGSARMGLSAVVEEADGAKSYWALAHPPGAPDFHHPDCFALHIPAPDAA